VLAALGNSGVEADGQTVELKSNDGARVAIDVVRALDAEKLEPASLMLREPTLDDVFLSITGHAAEEETTEAEPATGRHRRRGAA
jgi:ABC-2 type transport system ATP-binding protein